MSTYVSLRFLKSEVTELDDELDMGKEAERGRHQNDP